MKKFYEAPEMTISEFTLESDVLAISGPEGPLPEFNEGIEGFSW